MGATARRLQGQHLTDPARCRAGAEGCLYTLPVVKNLTSPLSMKSAVVHQGLVDIQRIPLSRDLCSLFRVQDLIKWGLKRH